MSNAEINAIQLARALFSDDTSRVDEGGSFETDGKRAYDGWVKAAREAGDRDTLSDLESVSRSAFAAEWDRQVAETCDHGDRLAGRS